MKVLVCSDTHRRHDNYIKAVEAESPFDFMIHCGDTEGGEYLIEELANCPSKIIMGNNDFFSDLPREEVFELGGKVVWVTHGHNYYVSLDTASIKEEAAARGANVVMFGHTHRPLIEAEEGIICMNPGSLSYPRQSNHRPSYIIIKIDENNRWNTEVKYL